MAFGPTSQDHVAQIRLGDLLANNLAAANLLGRLHVAQVGHRKTRGPIRLATHLGVVRNFAERDDAPQSQGDVLLTNFSFDVPPENAVQYLRNLNPVTREVFDGLVKEYQSDAFTIAGVNDQRLVAKIRDALAETLANGGTSDDFHKAVDQLTTDAGVEKISAFQLDTVFTTNMGNAYSSGRLVQMRDPGMMEALPYWFYFTAGDLRVRASHAVLDGFCAKADDPVWERIYPPNGYGCRCGVIPGLPEDAPKGSDTSGLARLPVMAEFARPPGWIGLKW